MIVYNKKMKKKINAEKNINYKNSLSIKFINLLIIISVLSLLFIILIPQSSALGVTPGRTTIDYVQGIEKTITFSLMNTEHKDMQVLLMASGELNESVTLYDSLVNFNSNEESKQFNYKIKIDEKLEPGLHTADIIALEVPKMSESGTYVGATVAVVSQLYVYVPCPGKCVDGDLNVFGAEQNSTVTFIVPVINRGKLGIGEVRAVIDIYTNLNRKIATVETDLSSISPGARTELTGKWLADVNIGEYTAKVTVLYDGESKTFEKQFSVGTNILNVESISVNDFTLGEIAKIKILVENRWNKELNNVFANLLVYNHDDQIMADVKSPNEDIPALSKKELIAYWDTVGVEEGEYVGKLMIHHEKRSADRNLILKIKKDSMEFSGIGYAISSKKGGGISMTTILVILVILLLVVNLAWFVFFNRMRRQESSIKKK